VNIKSSFLRNYGFSLVLLSSIIAGSLAGLYLKDQAVALKPLGDLFLNLLFTLVVPLVFFSISSAVAKVSKGGRLRRIMGFMLLIFVLSGVVAAALMVAGVRLFPPSTGVQISPVQESGSERIDLAQQLVRTLTVSDFVGLFSKENMLALIIMSVLVGLAASRAGEKAESFIRFLAAGNVVMGKLVGIVMFYAPIGLGAYFAYLVGSLGPQLFGAYGRVATLYYPLALFYFFAAFSLYAFLAARGAGVARFWKHIIPTALTAAGTGSSVATIPVNLQSAERIGIPQDIREVVIPVGATIHMEGSCLSAIVKIAFIFGIFGREFSGADVILGAIGIAILSGTVMGGIPGGGFLGEILIVTMYGLPPEALPLLALIGTIVDAPATMVNACGDTSSSMLVARIMDGKDWMRTRAGGSAQD
jgi:Na+/H+-dicarboxylate symporter